MGRGPSVRGFNITKKLLASGWKPGMDPAQFRKAKSVTAPSFSVPYNSKLPVLPAVPPDEYNHETDVQISKRIKERFEIMRKLAYNTAIGKNRALIVSGPPGLGKSFDIEKMVEDRRAKSVEFKCTFVKGFSRATGIYRTFYDHQDTNSLVIFDDADSIFDDETSLNLLKIACDTLATRRLSWLTEMKMTDDAGNLLPRHFEFKGGVIFITNLDFEKMMARGGDLAKHCAALISRSHYLDMGMKTRREYIIRIEQVLETGMLRKKGISPKDEKEIMAFIKENAGLLRELSLRTLIKAADLIEMEGKKWRDTAKFTLLKE